MELFEAISKRYSYRGEYEKRAVPREDLEKIVQAGIDAPTGKNAQSCEFLIVDDPALLKSMAELIRNKSMQNCPAAIVVVSDERLLSNGLSFFREDYGAAVQNMLLAITALEYAGVWIDGALKRDDIDKKLAQLLKVPESRSLQVVIPVGVPSKKNGTPNQKKPFSQRAWFNQYGEE